MPRKSKRRPRGRPVIHDEPWSKVSVVLFDREVKKIDQLISDARKRGRTSLNRASLIRAVVDGVLDYGLEMANMTTESALRRSVFLRFSTGQ